jgi:hypothetical protein
MGAQGLSAGSLRGAPVGRPRGRRAEGERAARGDMAGHRYGAERRLPAGAATAHLLPSAATMRWRAAQQSVGRFAGPAREMRRGAGAERPRAQPRSATPPAGSGSIAEPPPAALHMLPARRVDDQLPTSNGRGVLHDIAVIRR